MQFGVFTVGDVTPDPTTGRTPSEEERIRLMIELGLRAEELDLDVIAFGEHHHPPFVPSSPTTMLGYVAAGSPSRSRTTHCSIAFGARTSWTGRGSSAPR